MLCFKKDMNGSFAVIYVNINKSIRVHSKKKFLKDTLVISFFFFIFNYEKKTLKNKQLVQVYCQKRTHLGCQNISKHIETSDIDYIVVRGNYYFRVTKSYKRERIIISVLVHFRRNH